MLEKLREIEHRYIEIEQKISMPEYVGDREGYAALMREYKTMTPVVEKYREYRAAAEGMREAEEILTGAAEDEMCIRDRIDSAAPKGRLILPQQQTIRDVLEAGAISVVTRETELVQTLDSLSKKPRLVVTDSQAFGRVSRDTPEDILLTSFSILFARYKGGLKQAVRGAAVLDKLKDGDTVLISEGCTHHRQCEDIGTVKLPKWIRNYTDRKIDFKFTSGGDLSLIHI